MHALRSAVDGGELLGDAARRRHRLGQDRGLLRGGGAHARAGAAGAHHAAGDRAHRPVHAPLRGALRLRAGRMAFGAVGPGARARLARGRDGRGARRRRCPLGAVPALQGARPHRRRRGARHRASSRTTACTIRRATWPWCAAISAAFPSSSPRRRRRSRATSMRAPSATATWCCPARFSGAALPEVDRHRSAPQPRRTRANGCRRCWSRPSHETLEPRPADAAVPQPARLCAAHAVPLVAATASNARSARPGWSSTASAAGCIAIIAGSRFRCPRSAPSAGSRARWSPAGRASSASPRRWPSASPRRGWRCSPPTSCPASPRCAR